MPPSAWTSWSQRACVGAELALARSLANAELYGKISISGGPAPVRAYTEELLPDVLAGRIVPGRVFDRTVDLDGVPDGYRAMNDRESIKVMVTP